MSGEIRLWHAVLLTTLEDLEKYSILAFRDKILPPANEKNRARKRKYRILKQEERSNIKEALRFVFIPNATARGVFTSDTILNLCDIDPKYFRERMVMRLKQRLIKQGWELFENDLRELGNKEHAEKKEIERLLEFSEKKVALLPKQDGDLQTMRGASHRYPNEEKALLRKMPA